jgi:4-hydroxyphenylacetate 3-monooxygenase
MLRSGREHLERLRDGRTVYVGNERIDDVTSHPLFRNAARTVAAIYDMKADPANRELMSFAEEGERHSMYFLPARSPADLRRRTHAHQAIADMTYGMLGRSPDHVSSFVTGMAMAPEVFGSGARPFAANNAA